MNGKMATLPSRSKNERSIVFTQFQLIPVFKKVQIPALFLRLTKV